MENQLVYNNNLFAVLVRKGSEEIFVLVTFMQPKTSFKTFVSNEDELKEVIAEIEILGVDFFAPMLPYGWWETSKHIVA